MGNCSFSMSSLLGWLKGFLNSMSSPLGGFNIDDVQMNSKDGEYSVMYKFAAGQKVKDDRTGEGITDAHGNPIKMDLLITTANVQEAFAPLLSGLNNINKLLDPDSESYNPKAASALLAVFLGSGRESGEAVQESFIPKFTDPIFAATNNDASAAKGGLLGTDLNNNKALPLEGANYDGKNWSWQNIAVEMLKYSLECKVPGKAYGAIEDISLRDCSKLIGEYLVKTKTIANADEISVDADTLIRPLICRMQIDLKKYYTDIYNKYDSLKNAEDTYDKDQEDERKANEEKQKAEEEQNHKPEYRSVYKDGVIQNEFGKIDVATEAGAAQAAELESQGYIVDSKQINVTLRKITATSDIEMLALDANYLPSEVLNDLEDIMDQDDFIETITEDPQTYAISVDDDGFDIEQCGCCKECDPCASLCEVFKAGIRAYRNLYILHWMSSGNDMMKLHNLSEEMYDELKDEIDTIGELLVEKQGTVPQLDFECDYIPVQKYDFQTGLDHIKSLVQMYIDCIDFAYCNQDSDVQSTLDEWLRYWNKQLNYFVKNQEI